MRLLPVLLLIITSFVNLVAVESIVVQEVPIHLRRTFGAIAEIRVNQPTLLRTLEAPSIPEENAITVGATGIYTATDGTLIADTITVIVDNTGAIHTHLRGEDWYCNITYYRPVLVLIDHKRPGHQSPTTKACVTELVHLDAFSNNEIQKGLEQIAMEELHVLAAFLGK